MNGIELNRPQAPINRASHAVVTVLGVLLGISSIDHGVFEMMQGNHPTPGNLIKAQGPGHMWSVWTQGSEPAFTLVHNFLLTGALATLAGLLLVLWSLRFFSRRQGAAGFLLLSVFSYVVGGGLAQLYLFLLNWLVATRLRSSLAFWRWILPPLLRRILRRCWPWTLAATVLFFLTALWISGIGFFPGLPSHRAVLYRILLVLGAGILVALFLSVASAFAADVDARQTACGQAPVASPQA